MTPKRSLSASTSSNDRNVSNLSEREEAIAPLIRGKRIKVRSSSLASISENENHQKTVVSQASASSNGETQFPKYPTSVKRLRKKKVMDGEHQIKKPEPLSRALEGCREVLTEMFRKRHSAYAWPFYEPVNAEELGLDDYHDIIKKPIDLGTIRKKLNSRVYKSSAEFASDVRLMFANCYKYNSPQVPVVSQAKQLEKLFESRYATLFRKLRIKPVILSKNALVKNAKRRRIGRPARSHNNEIGTPLGFRNSQSTFQERPELAFNFNQRIYRESDVPTISVPASSLSCACYYKSYVVKEDGSEFLREQKLLEYQEKLNTLRGTEFNVKSIKKMKARLNNLEKLNNTETKISIDENEFGKEDLKFKISSASTKSPESEKEMPNIGSGTIAVEPQQENSGNGIGFIAESVSLVSQPLFTNL